jgi:DnaK suppressor protein
VNRDGLDIDKLTKELEEYRESLLSDLKIKGNGDKNTTLSGVANPDRADLAQDYILRDRRTALHDRLSGTLEQVEGALERIRAGVYGKCERCNKDISLARLNVLPYAELCIECQEKEEKNIT